jgi:hypothetical protein
MPATKTLGISTRRGLARDVQLFSGMNAPTVPGFLALVSCTYANGAQAVSYLFVSKTGAVSGRENRAQATVFATADAAQAAHAAQDAHVAKQVARGNKRGLSVTAGVTVVRTVIAA